MLNSELTELSGIGETTAQKLADAGISTLMSLAVSSPMEVSTLAGMSENKARGIIQQARDSLKLGFEKAKDFARRRENIKKIGTGCSVFDDMLDGGFESGAISEIYGQFGTGKTQLSHLLVVKAIQENKDNKAIFIDTENTFRADRIKDFAEANGLDPDDVLNRIYVSRSYNSDHQMLLVDEIEKMLQKDNTYRILVMDSLTSHFRAEFSGRGELAGRQQKLNKHMHQLLRIADLYNMVVLVTNQVHANPGMFYGDPTTPVGGHIVGHNSTFRIYLRPGKAGSIYAKLVDSPNLPNSDCNFYLTKEGFAEEGPVKKKSDKKDEEE
jgi:DNA repair protein RadA